MSTKRTHDSVSRALRVLKALRGHTLNGLSNAELAKALGESPANITRYMDSLIEAASPLASTADASPRASAFCNTRWPPPRSCSAAPHASTRSRRASAPTKQGAIPMNYRKSAGDRRVA